jgi:hypothetical protein
MIMLAQKRAAFVAAYTSALTEAVQKNPDDYTYAPAEAPLVVEKMLRAMEAQGPLSINRGSPAFKAACRALKIKNTKDGLVLWFGTEPLGETP